MNIVDSAVLRTCTELYLIICEVEDELGGAYLGVLPLTLQVSDAVCLVQADRDVMGIPARWEAADGRENGARRAVAGPGALPAARGRAAITAWPAPQVRGWVATDARLGTVGSTSE